MRWLALISSIFLALAVVPPAAWASEAKPAAKAEEVTADRKVTAPNVITPIVRDGGRQGAVHSDAGWRVGSVVERRGDQRVAEDIGVAVPPNHAGVLGGHEVDDRPIQQVQRRDQLVDRSILCGRHDEERRLCPGRQQRDLP